MSSNVDLLQSTSITIKGVTGTTTESSTLMSVKACGADVTGSWTQGTGQLVFALPSLLAACTACNVSWVVTNPCCCMNSPSAGFSIGADVTCNSLQPSANKLTVMELLDYLDPSVVNKTVAEVAPLAVRCPEWEQYSIGQSSKVPCGDNVVHVTLALNTPIFAADGMTVTLSGLKHSRTIEKTLTLLGHAAIRGGAGEFHPTESNGRLVFALSGDVPAFEPIVFNFTVINPTTPSCTEQAGKTVCGPACIPAQTQTVMANAGTGMTIPGDSRDFVSGCSDAAATCQCRQNSGRSLSTSGDAVMTVQVAEIQVRSIAQSTPWPCAKNVLTVSLSSTVPFAASHVHCTPLITISGLQDACLISSSVTLAGSNGTSTWGGNATFTSEGSLIVSPIADMDFGQVRIFQFDIHNPVHSQPAPRIQVSSSVIPVCLTDMIKDW